MDVFRILSILVIISAAEASLIPIEEITDNGPGRLAAIEITNNLYHTRLTGGEYITSSGHCSVPPPAMIKPQYQDYAVFPKTSFIPRGAVGFFQYRIGNYTTPGLRFVVFYSVPFDRNFAKNWYGLRFIDNNVKFDEDLYQEALNDGSWSSINTTTEKYFQYASTRSPIVISKNGFVVTAWMSDTAQALMKVSVDFFETPFTQLRASYMKNFMLNVSGSLAVQSDLFDQMIEKTRQQNTNRYSIV